MDGIVIINKPKQQTSHDIVRKAKKILNEKVGHTGTLDPNATGVLPLLIGKGTELSKYLINHDKTYEAILQLGEKRDTGDVEGKIIEQKNVTEKSLNTENINSVFKTLIGKQEQIPPIYSALKVNGKKLYELAREGKEVERKARPVTISKIKILQVNLEEQIFSMEVTCSKGTYIRTLCHDIGMKLGTGAAMENLIRTRVERFCIEDAITLDEIEHLAKEDSNQLAKKMIPIDRMFLQYPAMQIESGMAHYLANGNQLYDKQLKPFIKDNEELQKAVEATRKEVQERYRIYDENGQFRAIYQKKGREYHVVKMF